MRITNPETRAFLELNAPYWLGRLETAETMYSLFENKNDNGVNRTLGSAGTCLMGEIYGDTYDYQDCVKCSSLTLHWLLGVMQEEWNSVTLDKLIQHQIKCHKKPELKIPISLTQ